MNEGLETVLHAVREHGANIEAYAALGNIRVARQNDLLLFNYNERAVFEASWNAAELVCRGLIIHWPSASIVALPFPKFFNVGERPETQLTALPDVPVEVTDKMDGSMGTLFRAPDGYAVATRGSFSSKQALWATRHVRDHHAGRLRDLPPDITLLFEIIYPENREALVLRYGETEALFLIGARRFSSDHLGYDFGYDELAQMAERYGFPVVPRFHADSIRDLLPLISTYTGIEGWVVRFPDGLRVKVKTEEYLRLHRLISNLSPGRIREALLGDRAVWEQMVMSLPDEFQREARQIAQGLEAQVAAEEVRLRSIFDGPLAELVAAVRQDPAARKGFAITVRSQYTSDSPYLFALLDGRDIRPTLLQKLDIPPVI